MSIWLKKRLALWFGGAVALTICAVGATALKAQIETPQTAEEAAVLFGKLLATSPENTDFYSLKYRVISRQDRNKLGYNNMDPLLRELQKNLQSPAYEATASKQEDGATVVEISPVKSSSTAPVVVISQGTTFAVDLLATYAKRMNLQEGKLQTNVFNLTGVILPGLPNANSTTVQTFACQTRLKELQQGIMQYCQDYDEKLPPAEKWTDVVTPYVANKDRFNCPSVPGGKWGYAMNKNLSGLLTDKIKDAAETISLYETSDLIPNAFGTGQKMAFRHQGYDKKGSGSNVAFADGHIEFFPAKSRLEFGLIRKMRH